MIRKRVNTDLFLRLSIVMKDGSPANFAGAENMKAVVWHSLYTNIRSDQDFSVDGNVISLQFSSEENRKTGKYGVSVFWSKPDPESETGRRDYAVDFTEAFLIVSYSEQEDDGTIEYTGKINQNPDGINASIEQVQADWNEEDPTSKAFIKNKPGIPDISNKVDEAAMTDEGNIVFKSGDTPLFSLDFLTPEVLERIKDFIGVPIPPDYSVPTSVIVPTWQFSKDAQKYEAVTLPHTCNAIDGQTSSMYKGDTYYKATFNAVKSKKYLLYISKAGQVSEIYLNSVRLAKHYGGYTGFFVNLDQVLAGSNELLIKCNNQRDLTNIPVSADFNFNNGLYGEVYIFSSGSITFSDKFGRDRYHLTQSNITDNLAEFNIKAELLNISGENLDVVVSVSVKDAAGLEVASLTENVALGSSYALNKDFSISNPHLWNGVKDPYLYNVEIKVTYENKTIDTLTGKVGFRYFSMSQETGFSLNGQPYPLRGVSLHQDYDGAGSAMTHEQYDTDYANVMDIGANVVRLAHYPHDKYALDKCDELGLIVQTEIPWVNECGVNATAEYFTHIKENMQEMINNLYNHTCIVFWGMHNEMGGSHAGYPQGVYDPEKAKTWSNELYAYAKPMDSTRFFGYATNRQNQTGWDADYVSANLYYGWYYGTFDQFGPNVGSYKNGTQKKLIAVSEYGAGANPAAHSDDPTTTTNTGSGGARHDEEYQNLYHESHLEQIIARPYIQFTTIWAFNDFAVAGRNEGGVPYTNDKGLITCDRQIKKDAYYLYKAAWNATPFVYITSRRFENRETDGIAIKVYSNCESVSLYQNGVLKQTLTGATKVGVVFEFSEIKFTALSDTFKVVGTKDKTEVSDEVTFKTNTIAGAISVDKNSLSLSPGSSDTFTITTASDYTIIKTGDFFTYEDNNKVVTVTINNGITEALGGKLVIATINDSVEVYITASVVTELISISIQGNSQVTESESQYTIAYNPTDTVKTGVTWSIISGAEFATIDQNGKLTALDTGQVTIKAVSIHDSTIIAIKDVKVTISSFTPAIYMNFTSNTKTLITNAVLQDLSNAEMEIIFMVIGNIFGVGSRTSGSSNDRFAFIRASNGKYNTMYGNAALGDGGSIELNKRYKVTFDKVKTVVTNLDTGEIQTREFTSVPVVAQTNTAPISIGLLYNNGAGTVVGGNSGAVRVASVVIKENGILTHDFKPYKTGDEIGFIDNVTKEKYNMSDFFNIGYVDFNSSPY